MIVGGNVASHRLLAEVKHNFGDEQETSYPSDLLFMSDKLLTNWVVFKPQTRLNFLISCQTSPLAALGKKKQKTILCSYENCTQMFIDYQGT